MSKYTNFMLRNLRNCAMVMGMGNGLAHLVGNAFTGTTAVGNVGGSEGNLITYKLPASSMNRAKRGIRIKVWLTTANNANAKTFKLYFGSQIIHTSTLTISVAGKCFVDAVVYSTGSNTQKWASFVATNGAAGVALNEIESGTASQVDTAAIVIKGTGSGTEDNDIICDLMSVDWID